MAPPIGPTEEATMIDLCEAGWSVNRIAAHLDRNPQTVREFLAAERPIMMRPPGNVSEEMLRAVVSSYVDDGLSIRACARRHGLAVSTARRVLVSMGVGLRPQGAPRRRSA